MNTPMTNRTPHHRVRSSWAILGGGMVSMELLGIEPRSETLPVGSAQRRTPSQPQRSHHESNVAPDLRRVRTDPSVEAQAQAQHPRYELNALAKIRSLGTDPSAGACGHMVRTGIAPVSSGLQPDAVTRLPTNQESEMDRRGTAPRRSSLQGTTAAFSSAHSGGRIRTDVFRVMSPDRVTTPSASAPGGNRTRLTRLTTEPPHQMRTRAWGV